MGHVAFFTTAEEWTRAFPAFASLRPQMSLAAFLNNREHCLAGGYSLLGMIVDDVVVCVAGISVRPHVECERQLEIEDFSAHPSFKRRGYGRELLFWIIDYAKQQGCFRLKLDSGNARQDAHRFYEAAGLARTGFRFEKRFSARAS